MSIAQASLTVTAGASYTQYLGAPATVGAVVILNESPYGLNVSNGSSSQWIAAQTADLVPCDSSAFNGTLSITTDGYLSGAAAAPSYLVLFTTYAPGEAIRGNYPASLSRMLNVGNTVSTTNATSTPADNLEQDVLTPFVLSGLSASNHITTLLVSAGVALVRQTDASLGRVSTTLQTFTTTPYPSATLYVDLNPDGTFNFNTQHSVVANYLTICTVTTDASGHVATLTDTRQLNTTLLTSMTGDGGTLTLGADKVTAAGLTVTGTETAATLNVTGTGTVGTLAVTGTSSLDNGAITTTGSGNLTVKNLTIQSTADLGNPSCTVQPRLDAGHQEVGYVVISAIATAGGQQIFDGINFKTTLTNTLSGITFTLITSSNTNGAAPTSGNYSIYGCTVGIVSGAAGLVYWVGTYTTIGN